MHMNDQQTWDRRDAPHGVAPLDPWLPGGAWPADESWARGDDSSPPGPGTADGAPGEDGGWASPPVPPVAGSDTRRPSGAPPLPDQPPVFSRARRGYDVAEVDHYVAGLHRQLAAAHAERSGGPAVPDGREAAARELGTVLLDARAAADRIRAEAERDAAATVADAGREARGILDDARAAAERAATERRGELAADLADAERAAAGVREVTSRAVSEIAQWRDGALTALARIAAALEQWPGTVPDPASLTEALAGREPPPHGDAR